MLLVYNIVVKRPPIITIGGLFCCDKKGLYPFILAG